MAVYVDNLRNWGWKRGKSCHLIADDVQELKKFAVSIGLQERWFQPRSSPHFDLTENARKRAVERGAIELNNRDFVAKLREIRKKK